MTYPSENVSVDIGAGRRYERPTMATVLDDLFALINTKAYREGDFTLASGRKSRYYFNGKAVIFDQEGARLYARWLLGQLIEMSPRPRVIGGLEIGAIPIACTASALADFPLGAFVVRKRPKEHGTSLLIEGDLRPGDDVAIVDDVITTGESSLKAIRAVEEAGCTVRGVFCLVDRQEGHAPAFEQYHHIFRAAFTLDSFLARRSRL